MCVCGPRSILKVTVGAKKIGVRYLRAACLFTTTHGSILGHRHPPNRRGMLRSVVSGLYSQKGKKTFCLVSPTERLARPPIQ